MHAPVAAQTAECTWIGDKDAGLLLIGTFTDTSVRFVLRNNSSQAHRVTTDAFAQLHDCYLSPGHRCAIRGRGPQLRADGLQLQDSLAGRLHRVGRSRSRGVTIRTRAQVIGRRGRRPRTAAVNRCG